MLAPAVTFLKADILRAFSMCHIVIIYIHLTLNFVFTVPNNFISNTRVGTLIVATLL
jgi:hypothetical protein